MINNCLTFFLFSYLKSLTKYVIIFFSGMEHIILYKNGTSFGTMKVSGSGTSIIKLTNHFNYYTQHKVIVAHSKDIMKQIY